jgi:hypothetical protein
MGLMGARLLSEHALNVELRSLALRGAVGHEPAASPSSWSYPTTATTSKSSQGASLELWRDYPAVAADPLIKTRFAGLGVDPMSMTSAAFREICRRRNRQMGPG